MNEHDQDPVKVVKETLEIEGGRKLYRFTFSGTESATQQEAPPEPEAPAASEPSEAQG